MEQVLTISLDAPNLTLGTVSAFTTAVNELLVSALNELAVPELAIAGEHAGLEQPPVELVLIDLEFGSFLAKLRIRDGGVAQRTITAATIASAIWIAGGCISMERGIDFPPAPDSAEVDTSYLLAATRRQAGQSVDKFLQATPEFRAEITGGNYRFEIETRGYKQAKDESSSSERQRIIGELAKASVQLGGAESAKILRVLADVQDGRLDPRKDADQSFLKDVLAPLADVAAAAIALAALLRSQKRDK